jgi:hypothetical protein
MAYNKAVELVTKKLDKNYAKNYIEGLSSVEYAALYNSVRLKKTFRDYVEKL